VLEVNDAPLIQAQAASSYQQNGTAHTVLSSVLITDVDDTNLESATIKLLSPLNETEEILALAGSNPNITAATS
jgi:hypothetical protein